LATPVAPRQPLVLHLLPTLSLGGAELFVLRLARAAAVTPGAAAMAVAAMHRGGPVEARLRQAGVPVRVLGIQRASVRRPWAAARDARRLVTGATRLARELGADLIQTHLDDADWLGAAVARRLGLPLVLTFHSTRLLPEGRDEASLRARLRRHLQRRLWRRAGALVAVGREVEAILLAAPGVRPEQVHRIPSAIAEPCQEPREALRRRHAALLGPGPHLMSVGRLVRNKGHDLVLQAVARLRPRWPGLRLWIAGEGPERAALEAQAAELGLGGAVQLLGAREDVPDLLALADLYLSGSRWEGLGLAAAEAQAAGLPVVAFAVGGLRDVVAHERSGLLVPDGDEAALAAAAGELLADPARRRAMAAAGREQARPFLVQEVLAATCRVYSGLLGGGGESPRIRSRARRSAGPGT